MVDRGVDEAARLLGVGDVGLDVRGAITQLSSQLLAGGLSGGVLTAILSLIRAAAAR